MSIDDWLTGGLNDKQESRWGAAWVLVMLVVVLWLAATWLPALQGGSQLVQWVRTNDPANTDSDQTILDQARRVCDADPEERYKVNTYMPEGFAFAAQSMYCAGHR